MISDRERERERERESYHLWLQRNLQQLEILSYLLVLLRHPDFFCLSCSHEAWRFSINMGLRMRSDGFCSTDGLLVVSTCSSMETDHSIDRIWVNLTTCESYIQASGKYASPRSFQSEFLFLWKSLSCIARCSRPELHEYFIVYTPSAGYVSFSSIFLVASFSCSWTIGLVESACAVLEYLSLIKKWQSICS